MKVLVVGLKWPPETFLARLIEGLMEKGVEITVATRMKPSREWLSRREFKRVKFVQWEDNMLHKYFQLQILLRGKWDIIYSPWNDFLVRHPFLYDLGAPVVVSCRGSQLNISPHNPERADLKQEIPESFRRVAAVHCVSRAIAEEAAKYHLAPEKCNIIYTGVNPDFFCPGPAREKPNEKIQIVTTSRLTWRKGIDVALQALLSLKKKGLRFNYNIVGGGPGEQRVRFAMADFGLEKDVTVYDDCDTNKVRQILQEGDIFLLSSFSEGISNAVIEAMACELPVVSTDCGGMAEAITEGVEGFLVPTRDPQQIANKLEQLMKDPDLRARMGKAGREKILKHFHVQTYVDHFFELLEEVSNRS